MAREVIRPKLCSEHPHGEKAGFRKCAPCFVENPELGGRGCSKQRSGTPLRWAPRLPPTTWHLGSTGRQEVWKQIRKNRVFIHACVYEREKYESVNCMMKLKPLAPNEKYESGPRPPQGPGALGVCREYDPGAWGGDQWPGQRRRRDRVAGLSSELTATPGGLGSSSASN